MDKMLVWNNIERIMKEKNMMNSIFISNVDISLKTLFDWQLGNETPDIYMLPKIAKSLGVTIDELFYDENEVKEESKDDTLYIIVSKGDQILEKRELNDEIINKIEVSLDLDVKNIQCHGNISCKDLKDCSINANKVSCKTISGNVSASNVECEIVSGPVACGFNVHCKEVRGSVSSGHNVYATKIYGDVDATNIYYENQEQ